VTDAAKGAQPRLDRLGAYPFERLKSLFAGHRPNPQLLHIDAGAGEPRLPLPPFTAEVLNRNLAGFSKYPATRGGDLLCVAIADWLRRRYGLVQIDPQRHVLTANGTREALFGIAHALVNPEAAAKPWVAMPNPMYQIYLGAAITAGAEPWLLPCEATTGFAPDFAAVPDSVWAETAFVYLCSPSNPTGWVATRDDYRQLIELADRFDFVIVADECYSEIYRDEPPVGLLQVAEEMGRRDYRRCIGMNSLSKRSALPGLRSGLIAGDGELIARFAKLRSYMGPATPNPLQAVAAAAWSDEAHVAANLAIYRDSLAAFFAEYGEGAPPAGSFFVWLPVADDEAFALAAYTQQAVTILPGSYLAADDANGHNPGRRYVRAALIDGVEKARELAARLKKVRV